MDFYKIYDILIRFNDILYNLLYFVILFIVYKYIQNNPTTILEPCIGQGDLVEYIQTKIQNI
jgi:hypothetical protein